MTPPNLPDDENARGENGGNDDSCTTGVVTAIGEGFVDAVEVEGKETMSTIDADSLAGKRESLRVGKEAPVEAASSR